MLCEEPIGFGSRCTIIVLCVACRGGLVGNEVSGWLYCDFTWYPYWYLVQYWYCTVLVPEVQ